MGQTVQFRILNSLHDPKWVGNESQRKDTVISSFNKTAYKKTYINPNVVQILITCLEYMGLNIYKFLISQDIFADLKGPKEKYKLHYVRCTGPLFR